LDTSSSLKAPSADLTFLPDIRAEHLEERRDPRPRAVGSLHMQDGTLAGSLSMATEALDPVMRMLLAGRLRYVILDGAPMRYRQSLIRYYRLETTLDPDDYPDAFAA
jgi:hypothetical protein